MTKEQDKQIAEQVMGWEIHTDPEAPWANRYHDKDNFLVNFVEEFHPTTDANDDHLVLKHMRENLDFSKLWAFDGFVIAQWSERQPFHGKEILYREYEPGDFSKAALKVLEEACPKQPQQ